MVLKHGKGPGAAGNLLFLKILCIPPIRERDMDIDYYIQKYLIYYQDFEKKKVEMCIRDSGNGIPE